MAENTSSNKSSDGGDRSDGSGGSSRDPGPRLRVSGGFRELRSFRAATIIYDATVAFCERFVEQRSRTVDQMVQAARSGRQNIAEGSRAAATSSQTELRLVNVARASLDELLLDYEDFLRQRGLRQWVKDDHEARAVRAVGMADRTDRTDPTDQAYASWLQHRDPAVVANALICLIHQTNYLLDRQIRALERDFIHEGGYSEQLAAARMAEKKRQNRTDQTDRTDPTDDTPSLPACPRCGQPMAVRTVRLGMRAGEQFLGCMAYPACKGTRRVDRMG